VYKIKESLLRTQFVKLANGRVTAVEGVSPPYSYRYGMMLMLLG
jgi:hypothetical protein